MLMISSTGGGKEPRLLVFSVDVLEGEIVTFDSYPKSDGSRKSKYGKYEKETGTYQHVQNSFVTQIEASHARVTCYMYRRL
jgi:hypothetical protein